MCTASSTNAERVWNPNDVSYPSFNWNHALCYYPGNEYVDVIGLTGYNTGTYYSNFGEHWRSFHEIYDAYYADYCTWFTQPMMITEFSCSSIGGDKTAWVREMLDGLQTMPRVKMAVWWDAGDMDADGNIARAYFIDDSEELVELFHSYFTSTRQDKDGDQEKGIEENESEEKEEQQQ